MAELDFGVVNPKKGNLRAWTGLLHDLVARMLFVVLACGWSSQTTLAQKALYDPAVYERGGEALRSGDVEGALRNYCSMFSGRSGDTLWTLSAILVCDPSQLASFVASIDHPLPVFVQVRTYQGKTCYRICAGVTRDRNEVVRWRTLLPQRLLAEGPFPVPILLPCPSIPAIPRQDLAGAPALPSAESSVIPPPALAAHPPVAEVPVSIPDAGHRAEGEAWFQKGLSAQSKGQRARAVECYQRALAVDPDRPEVLNNLGVLSLEQSHYEEARVLFTRAIAQSPAYARAHLNLAGALWGLDRRQEALAEAREALAMDPTAVSAHLTLASFLLAMNMKAEAAEEARRVLLLEPGNAQAKVFLNAGAAPPAGEPGP
jgi:hypothetical protein